SKEKDLGRSFVVAKAKESSVEDPRGVEDDRVARGDHFLEIAKTAVRDFAGRAIDDHHPAVAAALSWMLGDSVGGEIVVVVGSARAVLSHAALSVCFAYRDPDRVQQSARAKPARRPELS